MSGDQIAPSFGESNGPQPPTPKQTPTSSIFPSPVFATPKDNQGRFDDSPAGGWTPRFAEDYSVFNSTPGNLRGTQGPFADFGSSTATHTPYLQSPLTPGGPRKRSFAEGVAAEIATHANHFSPNPNLPLPPVEPSRRLQSSPASVATEFNRTTENELYQESSSQERSLKKARRNTGELGQEEGQGQTLTPPPSARKERKLAPKFDTNRMQNDQGYSQQEFMVGNPHQQAGMGQYVTTPSDMFGYPMSAPATAAPYGDQRAFWAVDSNMAGMDIDFSGANGNVFQTDPSGQQQNMDSIDWSRTPQMFQPNGMVPQPNQENIQGPPNGEPSLISKAVMPQLDTGSDNQAMFVGQYPTPIDDAFGIVQNAGGVNPGLLFSRPPSSSLNATAFNQAAMPPSSSAPPAPQSTQFQPPPAPEVQTNEPAQRGKLGRSMSVREMGPAKSRGTEKSFASSPTKSSNRPGLGRSFSESRGKKPIVRTSLPALAPAPRTQQSGPSISRAIISQPSRPPSRPSGRTSPMKSDHHHRLSSLSSIPESVSLGPRTRTQAKFTIDANGRARVETTVIVDDDLPPPLSARKRHSAQQLRHQRQWSTSGSEHDDDDSSTDDEPIIIPSRNASFALPDPLKPTRRNPLHISQRSISEHSTTSYVSFPEQQDQDDPESEAETVMNDMTPTGGKIGDAAAELKKLRAVRHNRPILSPTKHKRFSSGGSGGAPIANFASHHGQRYTILSSPTKMTEDSLPTPASSSGQGVRCICNRPDVDREMDGFMVQCESCEMWLHGRCVNITKRTLPSVYVCLFCANTPNMRGGRIRDNGRVSMGGAPMGVTSPLAHKGFRSLR